MLHELQNVKSYFQFILTFECSKNEKEKSYSLNLGLLKFVV